MALMGKRQYALPSGVFKGGVSTIVLLSNNIVTFLGFLFLYILLLNLLFRETHCVIDISLLS